MQSALTRLAIRASILLLIALVTTILLIRTPPYQDHVIDGLINETCPAPCFMGIRPGSTSMSQAFFLLSDHAWVANSPDEFPSLVRESSRIGSWIPRTVVNWRWSEIHPVWIEETVHGNITLENNDVLNMDIQTRFLLGEIILAFGLPDAAEFMTSGGQSGQQLSYIAWYADENLLIQVEGLCSKRPPYHFPVRIIFRAEPPHFPESTSMTAVCE